MIILSFSGLAGAGKDTAARLLMEQMTADGIRVRRISFADKLKDACCAMYGWDRQRLESDPAYKEGGLGGWVPKGMTSERPISRQELDDKFESIRVDGGDCVDFYMCWVELDLDPICVAFQMTRRQIMQRFGTECMREQMHPQHWIVLVAAAIQRGEFADVDIGFITDARFHNELTFARELGGMNILIQRADGGTLTQHNAHASEQEWQSNQNWHVILQNDISRGEAELKRNASLSVYTALVQRGIGGFNMDVQRRLIEGSLFGQGHSMRITEPSTIAKVPLPLVDDRPAPIVPRSELSSSPFDVARQRAETITTGDR